MVGKFLWPFPGQGCMFIILWSKVTTFFIHWGWGKRGGRQKIKRRKTNKLSYFFHSHTFQVHFTHVRLFSSLLSTKLQGCQLFKKPWSDIKWDQPKCCSGQSNCTHVIKEVLFLIHPDDVGIFYYLLYLNGFSRVLIFNNSTGRLLSYFARVLGMKYDRVNKKILHKNVLF